MKSKSHAQKIQSLLIEHLLSCGKIDLRLPDGVEVEIGNTQEDKHGSRIADDYCYVKVSRNGRSTFLDQNNLSVEYSGKENTLIYFFDNVVDLEGNNVKRLDII